MKQVSHSEIRCYKTCRRKYYLEYVEGIKPKEYAQGEALFIGGKYHEKLELMFKGESYYDDDTKTTAMALAFERHILPKLELVDSEKFVKRNLADTDYEVIGYVDAMDENGIPVEHKTTSFKIDETYFKKLEWDEQILMYMMALGVDTMVYTVIKKPTIRQKQSETDSDFLERCSEWYEVETDEKISMFKIKRTLEELAQFEDDLKDMIFEIENCDVYFKNPYNCNGFMTCPYESICLTYQKGDDLINFEKVENKRRIGVDVKWK